MWSSIVTLCFLLTITVGAQNRPMSQAQSCPRPVDARLRDYFEASAVSPTMLVNNDSNPARRKSQTTRIPIEGHEIEWVNVWNADRLSTSIKIDGNLISFRGRKTVNIVDNQDRGELDLVENWRQAKLYELSGHDVIGIEMGPAMCTGLMCSVSFQLIYDVKSKTANLFGTYRADRDVNLYRLGNEDKVFYLSKTFIGAPNSPNPVVTEYDPFELTGDGKLREYRDKNDAKYWLRHQYSEFEFEKPQKLDQHWFEKIE
jgi:hypothetical protein